MRNERTPDAPKLRTQVTTDVTSLDKKRNNDWSGPADGEATFDLRRAAMGWFRRRIKNPVMGTAQIVQCSQPASQKAIRARCILFVVVDGPGLEAESHEVRRQIEVARWPSPGMTLPCTIDRERPSRFEIDFDAIPDWRDRARAEAAQVAAGANEPAGGLTNGVGSAVGSVTVLGASTPEAAAEGVRRAEQALGMDLDGDGQVG